MEELTNNVNETIEVEVIEPTEVLETIENEEIQESSNKTVIAVAVGAAVAAGAYGVKKFIDWRKKKKAVAEWEAEIKSNIEKVEAEMKEDLE